MEVILLISSYLLQQKKLIKKFASLDLPYSIYFELL